MRFANVRHCRPRNAKHQEIGVEGIRKMHDSYRNGRARAAIAASTRQVRAAHPGNFLAPSPTEVWLGRSDPAQQEHEILGTPATLQVISKHDVAPATTLRQAAELLKKHTLSTTSCGIFSMPPVRPGRIFTSVIAGISYFPAASSFGARFSAASSCELSKLPSAPCVGWRIFRNVWSNIHMESRTEEFLQLRATNFSKGP